MAISGGREGEAVLPDVCHQPAQDDRPDAVIPCRVLQSGRQPVRPAPVPLQRPVAVAVPLH